MAYINKNIRVKLKALEYENAKLKLQIEKMKRCDNCKYRLISGIAAILEDDPEEPCLGCKEYNRWEIKE